MITIKEAQQYAGTLGNPSKMPGKSTSSPASQCITGSKLREVEGSVCEGCYAMKGNYVFPAVQQALQFRLDMVKVGKDNPERWINAMVKMISKQEWFRWHDSGDLQGVYHLANICEVARRTPNTNHWIPTREYRMVKDYLDNGGTIPGNLAVRLSAHMINGSAPEIQNLPTSVVLTEDSETVYNCPARHQDNECGDCRACWSPAVKSVAYHKH